MISKEHIYKKAFEIKKESAENKQQQRDMMLNAAYTSKPRLKEIDRELSGVGASLAINALSGGAEMIEVLRKKSAALSLEKNLLLKECEVGEISYDCPLCCDTGYIKGKICGCIEEIAKKITVEELSKEMPIEECRFDNFDLKFYLDSSDSDGANPRRRMTSIFKLCKEYAINFNPKKSENLLFLGEPGLGKTHLSLSIVNEVISKGFLPIYGSAENLFNAVENERFSNKPQISYDAMLCCDLLVIDDLGTEVVTSVTKSILYNIINSRILSSKPTIINTNLSMKEIETLYSPRISSRLIGAYDAHKFLGNDIRQQKAIYR